MNTYFSQSKKGFAMLFTVMLVGIILAIALGISEITFKQVILSNLASDSQLSFYQADAGMECGMLYDFKPAGGILSNFQTVMPTSDDSIQCGDVVLYSQGMKKNEDGSTEYLFSPTTFEEKDSAPCYRLAFIKSSVRNVIESYGYNTCNTGSPRQVERALRVVY